MTAAYTTVEALKARHDVARTQTMHDSEYAAAILAASGQIDEMTGRRFAPERPAARTFRAMGGGGVLCAIDDARGSLTVKTSTAGLAGPWSDFPGDVITHRAVRGHDVVEMIEASRARFPVGDGAWVQVTPSEGWGWESVPDQITEAALLQAARLFKRRSTPEGSIGFEGTGVITVDRDFDRSALGLVRPFVRASACAP